MNPDCVAKKIKSFSLFTSRDAMNIDGLSEATLEKFIAMGFIHNFGDIFEIAKYRDEIVEMDGFGEKSFDNLMVSIEKAKETVPAKVLYSLGIANIGLSNAKVICRHFEGDLAQIRNAKEEEVGAIDVSVQLELLKKCSALLKSTNSAMNKLSKAVAKVPEIPEGRERAVYCKDTITKAMEELRTPVDELEMLVDKEMWPMPSYGDLIFEV